MGSALFALDTCVSGTGAGAASLAACTNTGEADSAGVRALALVDCWLIGLCIASMALTEKPYRSGMHDGCTKGSLSSKISTSLLYAISPVGIQTFTRDEVALQPRKMPHTFRALLDVLGCDARMVFGVSRQLGIRGGAAAAWVKAQPMWEN